MKAADIPDALILDAITHAWATHWDLDSPNSLPRLVPELRTFPEKVLIAKLKSMVRRGVIDGCECGKCRGDWTLSEPAPYPPYCNPLDGKMCEVCASKVATWTDERRAVFLGGWPPFRPGGPRQ